MFCFSLNFWMFRNKTRDVDFDGDDLDDDDGHVDDDAGEAQVPGQLHRLKSEYCRRLGLHGS